jgi:hypothetical protein
MPLVASFDLSRYWLFQISGQIFKNLLFALLDFEENWFGHSQVVVGRMDFASLQKHYPQITNALLSEQHLVVGLNHNNSSSTIPRFRKVLEV